jgi:hypothetical protein
MRVNCREKSAAVLSRERGENEPRTRQQYPLVVGKDYVVYAVVMSRGRILYLVQAEFREFPLLVPCELFQVSDGSVSRYWRYGVHSGELGTVHVLGYQELADSPSHYEQIAEWAPGARGEYARAKALLDLEFPDPAITQVAESIEPGWLLCPECGDAWPCDSTAGMVKCPKCHVVLRNPAWTGDPS